MSGDCNTSTNTADDNPTDLTAEEGNPDLDDQVDDPHNSTQKRSLSPAGSQHQTSADNQEKKKFKPRSKIQQIASTARELKILSESVTRMGNTENEWDIYGRHVAAQLKLLSPVQAITAQMEINNVLTKCRFNDLYGTSTQQDLSTTVSTANISRPSTSFSDVYLTSPGEEEEMSTGMTVAPTLTPGQSTFSQAFSALGYKQDG